MAIHPTVVKVQRRMRVQHGMVKAVLCAFIVGGVSGGLIAFGKTVFKTDVLDIAGGIGLGLSVFVVIVGMLSYLVAGLFVRSAVKELDEDALLGHPLEIGEQFGRMKVVECDGTRVTLAMGGSPLVAGLGRLVACILLLSAGVAIGVAMVMSSKVSVKAGFFAGLLILAAVGLASVPFAMMWTAGPLQFGSGEQRGGGVGIEIERVRWFLKRDVMVVRPEEIKRVFVGGMYLTLHTHNSGVVALTRTSGSSILDQWNKQRLIAALEGVLKTKVQVEREA